MAIPARPISRTPGRAAPPAPKVDYGKKFGFAPMPESVRLLTEMLAKRNANMEDFAKIVAIDSSLTERLLAAANPRATRKEDYRTTTVEDAIQRVGMSFALLLAMSEPLTLAVYNTFHTMLSIDLTTVPLKDMEPFTDEHVLGEVTFEGKTTGLVDIRLPSASILLFGDRLLGLTPDDLSDPAIGNDVVGEMCNMIVGNFKSNLCDAGLDCKLSQPNITRTTDFNLQAVKGGTSERNAFHAEEIDFFTDLSVNPWVDCKL